MAHMQISTETSTWLLQAKDFLDEARRLRPGPARNELRQVAKVLRELAKRNPNPHWTLIGRREPDRAPTFVATWMNIFLTLTQRAAFRYFSR
jgi:hypothetical protein